MDKDIPAHRTHSRWALIFVAMVLSACATPVIQGSYYLPVYPGTSGEHKPNDSAWIPSGGKSGSPTNRLRMRDDTGNCYLELTAMADEANFLLRWTLEKNHRNRITGQSCEELQIGSDPVVIEDLDSGQRMSIRRFNRSFLFPPALNAKLSETVDMAALIPGFAEVPAAERWYTLSISFRREFKGKLPERVTIQLPPILVAGRSIQLLPLDLQRKDVPSTNIRAYVPLSYKEIPYTTALKEFGEPPGAASFRGPLGMMFSPGIYVWHEQEELRLAAGFMGREDDLYIEYDKKSGGTGNPFISGEIYAEVLSGSNIRLQDNHVLWQQTPGDVTPVAITPSRWRLSMYPTTDYAELPKHFLANPYNPNYENPSHIEQYDDWQRQFIFSIPNYQPKRIRVTLPPITANGKLWPIEPIEFHYKAGGVGLAVWP
jgi:hypothetical protein